MDRLHVCWCWHITTWRPFYERPSGRKLKHSNNFRAKLTDWTRHALGSSRAAEAPAGRRSCRRSKAMTFRETLDKHPKAIQDRDSAALAETLPADELTLITSDG